MPESIHSHTAVGPASVASATAQAAGDAPRTEALPDQLATLADQVLRIRRPPVETPPAGSEVIELVVPTTPGWPDGAQVSVRVTRRGRGPAALVVHGLQGRPSDLGAITEDLLAAGYTVWAPDLPAHGGSSGERLSIPLVSAVLRAVGAVAGPFDLALAHSIGGACLVQALEDGLIARRIVLLAVPTHFGSFVRATAKRAGLDRAGQDALVAHVGRLIADDPDRMDMARQARERREPVLFVHSDDDPVVPFQGAQRVATVWPGARWAPVTGLSHTRPLLDDPGVRALVRDFV